MSTNNFVTVVSDGELKQIRYDVFVGLLFKYQSFDLQSLHAAVGITEEAGEVAGVIKKHIIYQKPLDKKKLREELGDLRFYIEAVCNLYDLDDQEILQENANKLAARYKELTYSDTAANARADMMVLPFCSVCGEELCSSPSGSVCKNGHGGTDEGDCNG